MYAEGMVFVVNKDELTREFSRTVVRVAGGTPGVLSDELRVQRYEQIDDDNVRISLVHRDLYEECAAVIDTSDMKLRAVG